MLDLGAHSYKCCDAVSSSETRSNIFCSCKLLPDQKLNGLKHNLDIGYNCTMIWTHSTFSHTSWPILFFGYNSTPSLKKFCIIISSFVNYYVLLVFCCCCYVLLLLCCCCFVYLCCNWCYIIFSLLCGFSFTELIGNSSMYLSLCLSM